MLWILDSVSPEGSSCVPPLSTESALVEKSTILWSISAGWERHCLQLWT